jgi:hypothetical protein
MRKWIVLAMVIGLLIIGCANTQRACFSTNEQLPQREATQLFESDRYQCVQESKTYWSGGGSGLLGATAMVSAQASANKQARTLYEMCMRARGYVFATAPKGKTWSGYTLEEKVNVVNQICPSIPIDGGTLINSKSFREYRNAMGYSIDRCLQR